VNVEITAATPTSILHCQINNKECDTTLIFYPCAELWGLLLMPAWEIKW